RRRRGARFEHVALGDARAAEPPRVRVVGDLENASVNVLRIAGEEALNVVAVDGQAAVEAELAANGSRATQMPELHPTHRRTVAGRMERGGQARVEARRQQARAGAPRQPAHGSARVSE